MRLKKNKHLKITCDGGAATGKSTGAKLIAKKLNISFLSSGLLYRYASYLILKYNPKLICIEILEKSTNGDKIFEHMKKNNFKYIKRCGVSYFFERKR